MRKQLQRSAACLYQVLGEDVDRPAVGRDDLVIERGNAIVAVEAFYDQRAEGGQEPTDVCPLVLMRLRSVIEQLDALLGQ